MSRGSLIGLMVTVLILFFVYSYLKNHLVREGPPQSVVALDEAAVARCLANQHALRAAIAGYRLAHGGQLPATLDELVPGFLGAIPHCSSGGLYEYDPRSGDVLCPEGHGG